MSTAWHQRLMAGLPSSVRNQALRFEAAIEDSLARFAASLPPGTRVLDAGAGEARHAGQFAHCRYVAVDLAVGDAAWDYSRLDARAGLSALPLKSGSFGAAISIVVLEHLADPGKAVSELGRVLAPDGRLLVVVPQEWGMHQEPHDFFRFTRFGLERLLTEAGFVIDDIAPVGGFFTLLGRRVLDSVLYFQGGWRTALLPVAATVAAPIGLLLPWLDFLDEGKRTTLGYVCLARKRA